jgi:TRAP-type C4-dicarboxylate transport system permease small subunit
MILLGFCAPLDALSSVLPEKLRWTPRIIMWICVLVFTYYSLFTYYYDYVRFPNA